MMRFAVLVLLALVLLSQGDSQQEKLGVVSEQAATIETILPKEEFRRLEEQGAGEAELEEGEDYIYVPFFYFILSVLLGVGTLQILSKSPIPLPYTVAVFLEGFAIGSMHWAGFDMGQLSESIDMWVDLDADLLLVVFLPPLIFGDTFKCSWQVFKTALPQCLTLAFPGIVIGSFLGMVVFYYILPYNWDLNTSLCFASILGATDPVAVVGLLGSLGCSDALQMQIGGESLLNDGSAMVIFYIALDLMSGESYGAGGIIELFCRLALGGIVFGFLLGLLVTFAMYLSSKKASEVDGKTQIILTVVTAYGAFYLATHGAFHVSEVLATVTASMVIARSAWPLIVEKEGVILVWEIFCYIAETMIFFLAGTLMSKQFEKDEQYTPTATDWGWMFIIYLVAAGIRLVMLLLVYPILRSTGYGTNWKDTLVMWWGGLRGAVGLALALTVMRTSEVDTKTGHLFVFHVGGTAMWTLVLNATTCAKLVKCLGLAKKSPAHILNMKQFEKQMHTHVVKEFYSIRDAPRFDLADDQKVKEIVSSFAKVNVDAMHAKDVDSRQVSLQAEDKHEQVIDLDAKKTEEEILVSVRIMYYKVLKHEYWKMIDGDLLPSKTSTSTILLESVDAASPLHPLCDFDALLEHISTGNRSSYYIVAAMQRVVGDLVNGTGIGRKIVPLIRGFTRFDAYGLLCCMDAHYLARMTLMDLDFAPTSEIYRAHYEVIQESIQQTQHIKTFLTNNAIDDEIISLVRTKMLILYLLKKKEKIVMNWVEKGVLCDADKEVLLEESDEEVRKAWALQPSSTSSSKPMDLTLTDQVRPRPSSQVSMGSNRLKQYSFGK